MSHRPAAAAASCEEVLQPFLRFDAPVLLPPPRRSSEEEEAEWVAGRSLASSKLAAAKNAARQAYVAAQESSPAEPFCASNMLHHMARNSFNNSRSDPSRRMPTPPVAGRRRPIGTRPHTLSAAGSSSAIKSAAATASFESGADHPAMPLAIGQGFGGATAKEVLPSLMRHVKDATHILHAIFPAQTVPVPETGESAVMRVSAAPASREEIAALHEQLRSRLLLRRAKADGYCPIRRQIYEDVFCELIRQTTIDEPARGILLQRLKDEMRQTMVSHVELLNRSKFFSSRKMLDCRRGMDALTSRAAQLEEELRGIEARKHDLEVKRDALNRRIEEEQSIRIKVQEEEVAYLRKVNQQLSLRLKMETERAGGAPPVVDEGAEQQQDDDATHA